MQIIYVVLLPIDSFVFLGTNFQVIGVESTKYSGMTVESDMEYEGTTRTPRSSEGKSLDEDELEDSEDDAPEYGHDQVDEEEDESFEDDDEIEQETDE